MDEEGDGDQAARGEETENPQPGPTEETENPQPGPTEETENPQPGPTEESENPQPGPTEETESPQPGPTEETENPQPGPTEDTIPAESNTLMETVVPESTITDTVAGDTVTSAAGDDITTATQPDISPPDQIQTTDNTENIAADAPPETAAETEGQAGETGDIVAEETGNQVAEETGDLVAEETGDTVAAETGGTVAAETGDTVAAETGDTVAAETGDTVAETDTAAEVPGLALGGDDAVASPARAKAGVTLTEPPRPHPPLQTLTATPLATPRRVQSHMRGITSQASSRPSVGGALPSLAPSRAEIGRIPSAGRDRRDVQTPRMSRESTRIRNVPNVIKMATVTTASAKIRPETPIEYYQSGYYGETGVRRLRKVVSWDEATNARPPLRIDMDGPTPWSYSPVVKPLKETNAPAWSFGKRSFVEKKGGSRRSWEKSWFHTDDVWKMKTDFVDEVAWPSPTHYHPRPTLGPKQSTKLNYPAFSCGRRRSFTLNKRGSKKEPAPNEYDKERADKFMYRKAPSFSHSHRNGGTALWAQGKDVTPGPGAYEQNTSFTKKHKPSFSIIGVRRSKAHELGPFATF